MQLDYILSRIEELETRQKNKYTAKKPISSIRNRCGYEAIEDCVAVGVHKEDTIRNPSHIITNLKSEL